MRQIFLTNLHLFSLKLIGSKPQLDMKAGIMEAMKNGMSFSSIACQETGFSRFQMRPGALPESGAAK